jgi:hypothetical protein
MQIAMNPQPTVPIPGAEILKSRNGSLPHDSEDKTLPLDSPQSLSAEQMLYRLARFFRRYLHCAPEQLAVLSLWTVHTHCFSAARTTPYLHIGSREKQSGKTICLELLSLVSANPWFATGISARALLRHIGRAKSTVLLDECQTIFGASDRKVRGVLVSGCKRGGNYDVSPQRPVDVFCPKVFAGMSVLPPAVADRSLPILLRAQKPDGTTLRFIIEQAREEAAPLVAWLKQWAAQNLADIGNIVPCTRDQMPGELNARQQDCIEPLLHIANLIGGQVPKQARDALVEVFRHGSTQGCFVHLLSDVRDAFEKVGLGYRIPTSVLLHFLNSLESRPWRTWHDGQPMTPTDLARILRPLGINSGNIRITRQVVVKGYCRRDLVPLWQHYFGEKIPEVCK